MSGLNYKKGNRRKENLRKSKNSTTTQYTSIDVEKRINERIEWCKKSYGESKMLLLIDMSHHNNRRKALYRLRGQHNLLRSYISLLSSQEVYVFLRDDTDTKGTIEVATIEANPNVPAIVYCKIDIQPHIFSITSDKITLTSENIRYIKRIVYLSGLGQIS